ncbi:MAG: hypothetical protein ACI89J_003056 [Hyphomicrobiaceae bacterium]
MIILAIAKTGNVAPAQVRFQEGVPLVRCKTKYLATSEMGHKEPVVARNSRELITQKPPITERNVTLAEVTPEAASHGNETLVRKL